MINKRLQPVREFLRADIPVAQAGAIVVAFAEPSIVHHEQFDPELGGLIGEPFLCSLVDIEFGRFP